MNIKLFICFCSVIYLAGCQSTSPSAPLTPPDILNNVSFEHQPVESVEEIFSLSPEIINQFHQSIHHTPDAKIITRELLTFIFESSTNKLNYVSGSTLTANQTFSQQNANCLSLSILAHALAEELGLDSRFQRVYIPEYWALDQGFNMLTGHVNLKINRQAFESQDGVTRFYNYADSLTVDFDPNSREQGFPTQFIDKSVIAAMFYNNKGAQALVNQQYDRAFSYFKAGIDIAPHYSGSWGNVGILFKLNNQYSAAEQAYQFAIKLDEDNNTAKGNLAILLSLTGREEQAKVIQDELELKRQSNPYYHIAKGNEAYIHNEYQMAMRHYRKALTLDKKSHESYFGLARSYYQLGDTKLAERYLKQAHKSARFSFDIERYQSKLSHLSAAINY
ncbi:tetratricopeptide repeat protein [Pseudoalteromonas ulvae]|uniref:Uncharacterized protein n=1 Tax=Pseudoalteromonas ulvae TaxID=107327 RepID=A0A244CV46_PSEDV|nr:tetratricopeptide repeat protein [Pseudoalteromonas ulvae]OUL59451.1 hypothetical protein B1199_04060 [Pseudoalteromonas ulvae]